MQSKVGYRLTVFAVVSMLFLLLISYAAPTANYNSNGDDRKSVFTFFEDYEGWMLEGYERYGEFSVNASLTAGVVVGVGEEYESIQDALDVGFSCLYLKKQRFHITEPITPPKEDFHIISDGAEIVAVKPMSTVFDIRNIRYAHLDGLFINGNGLAEKCIDAIRMSSQVPVHQIRNCKIWGAKFANVDLTGCEDTLLFNCWIDGRITNDVSDAITEYGVKIGEARDGYRTGGQVNLIHCLFGFHRKADVYSRNVAELKLANCLLASKTVWSDELEAHIIVEGGTGENALLPVLELTNCWVENGLGGDVPNILVRNRMISKLTVVGGMFYTDNSPNIYSQLSPCAETITLIGALFENNFNYDGFNVVAPTQKLVSIGNTYNWHGIDKTNVATYLIFDKDDTQVETNIKIKTNNR
ncbi:MAG: hypothetical protein QHH18_05055 [Candidatus Bathyarchaeota archaeon]|jgi:hypothetical protein|nr:hypothetical protein [Candidatus Bathyarchaeota archaeon A05DMB-5]MDH7557957.1 hypothetical protein [Candidatus Bathyarchaeota archaeon]